MKIKASKLLAVLCAIAMIVSTLVPMAIFTAAAADDLSGRYYIATKRSSGNYFYMTSNLGTASTKRYQAVDSGLTTLPSEIDENSAVSAQVFVLENNGDGTYCIYAEGVDGDNYLGWSSGNSGILVAASSAKKLTITATDGTYTINFDTRYLQLNNTSGNNYFAWYTSSQARDLVLIPVTSNAGGDTPDTPTCEHTNTVAIGEAQDATCTEAGITAGEKCADCGEVLEAQEEIPALGHNYVDGVCDECGEEEPAAGSNFVFELGANGSASHYDGSGATTYSETVDGYTLNITGGNKMYTGARDLKGNSCIKLGTGSAAGGFTFTVPDDVTEVVIRIANYKANTAKLTINGSSYTLTKNSNDGAYDEITVYTTIEKTVTLTTVSGGYRAMVNSIAFVTSVAGDCTHTNTTTVTVDATCTTAGSVTVTCDDCETVLSSETIPALGHNFVDGVCTVCTKPEYAEVTIAEALKLADGDGIIVSGVVVVEINTAWNSTYNNITVTVEDPETGDTLYVYRLATNVEVGDILTIKGAMGTHNGSRQVAQGATAEITGKAEVAGPDYVEVGLDEAVTLDDGAYVLVKGTVCEINTAWSDSNQNMSVTITDAEGNTLYIYKLQTEVGLGDEVAISGKVGSYNGDKQIVESTAEILKVGPVTDIAQMSVNAGADLSLLAHITLMYGENIADYSVKFVRGNAEVVVTAYTELNGKYVFALDKIAPQAMADDVTVYLMKGEEVVDTLENYSVKAYAQAILNGNYDAEIKTLVSDMLAYGAAAQKHTGYNVENLATTGVNGLVCSTATPNANVNVNKGQQLGDKVDGLRFTSVGVRFDSANYIYAKFTAPSLDNITVTINGDEAEIFDLGNGTYIVYSVAILATQFGDTYTIVLNNGEDYQTLTYSVNSYAFAKANTELGATLYRYGASATALAALLA